MIPHISFSEMLGAAAAVFAAGMFFGAYLTIKFVKR